MENGNLPLGEGFVTPGANMIPPAVDDQYARRPYVTRRDAPAVHARLCRHPSEPGAYCLNFNGIDIITLRFEGQAAPGLRAHSDGDCRSTPMLQQFMLWGDKDTAVNAEFSSPVELMNMRPRRAVSGEAILGQLGSPLMYGVNGMYLPDWDLLISWHGAPFSWLEREVRQTPAGYSAHMRVQAGNAPWIIVLRPHYYREHLGYSYHQPWRFRPNPKPVSGWSSWEAYHSQVSQEHIASAAQQLSALVPYGLEYMQLDDGYQQELVPPCGEAGVYESWLNTNPRFPGGHEAIINAMRAGGFSPGIWTNATLTNRRAAEKMDCVLRDREGGLIRGDWILFPLDCRDETLARHVEPCYRAFRELGYTYVKSDSLRHLLYDGLQEAVRLGAMEPETARERQRAYMEAARRGLGADIYYLSCWGVLSQSIGVADAMRVATDSSPRWQAYSMQLRETARWFFAQRVMFTLDPDMVCVRGKLEWARMALSLVALSGGVFMLSDAPEQYDAERLELIKRTLPALSTRAAETGPIDYTTPACPPLPRGAEPEEGSRLMAHTGEGEAHPFSSLWCTHFAQGGRVWAVVQRAAVVPLEAAEVGLEALALDPAHRYYACDFWSGRGAFVENGALRLPALELGDTAVIALTDISAGVPALLASDRHVSMDAVSVRRQTLSAQRLTLELKGFPGLEAVYTLYTPDKPAELNCEGAEAKFIESGEISKIKLIFRAEAARLTIN